MSLRHANRSRVKVFPHKNGRAKGQIDRLQEMSADMTSNRVKINELGRVDLVDWQKQTPEVTVSMRQFEYGSLETWNLLSNSATDDTVVDFNDFKNSMVDLAVFSWNDDDTFKSTIWLEDQKVTGFSFNIGDPEAIIERTLNLKGEKLKELQGNNKYLVQIRETIESGEAGDHTITIGAGDYANYPDPVANPDSSSGDTDYILKVIHYDSSAGTTDEADNGTSTGEWDYDSGTKVITFYGAGADDVYLVFYSATTYVTAEDVWTDNDGDLSHCEADSVTVLLRTASGTVYRAQNVSVDVSFEREDVREIGNAYPVAEGVRDKTVRITIDKILENLTEEENLVAQSADYGIIDIDDFTDEITMVIKVYSDSTKATFKVGYEFSSLAVEGESYNVAVNDYSKKTFTLVGQEGFITNDDTELTF